MRTASLVVQDTALRRCSDAAWGWRQCAATGQNLRRRSGELRRRAGMLDQIVQASGPETLNNRHFSRRSVRDASGRPGCTHVSVHCLRKRCRYARVGQMPGQGLAWSGCVTCLRPVRDRHGTTDVRIDCRVGAGRPAAARIQVARIGGQRVTRTHDLGRLELRFDGAVSRRRPCDGRPTYERDSFERDPDDCGGSGRRSSIVQLSRSRSGRGRRALWLSSPCRYGWSLRCMTGRSRDC